MLTVPKGTKIIGDTKMNNTAKLGLVLPSVLNPATAAVVGVGLGLLWLLRDDGDEATVDTVPVKRPQPTLRAAVEPLPAVELDVEAGLSVANEAVPAPIPEADKKEMIRNAMSELGKRSAASRAKKKAERQERG